MSLQRKVSWRQWTQQGTQQAVSLLARRLLREFQGDSRLVYEKWKKRFLPCRELIIDIFLAYSNPHIQHALNTPRPGSLNPFLQLRHWNARRQDLWQGLKSIRQSTLDSSRSPRDIQTNDVKKLAQEWNHFLLRALPESALPVELAIRLQTHFQQRLNQLAAQQSQIDNPAQQYFSYEAGKLYMTNTGLGALLPEHALAANPAVAIWIQKHREALIAGATTRFLRLIGNIAKDYSTFAPPERLDRYYDKPVPSNIQLWLHRLQTADDRIVEVLEVRPEVDALAARGLTVVETPVYAIAGLASNGEIFFSLRNEDLRKAEFQNGPNGFSSVPAFNLAQRGHRLFIERRNETMAHANVERRMAFHASPVVDYIQKLTGQAEISLLGHSMGGNIAAFKVIDDSRRTHTPLAANIKGIVMIGSPFDFEPSTHPLYPVLKALIDALSTSPRFGRFKEAHVVLPSAFFLHLMDRLDKIGLTQELAKELGITSTSKSSEYYIHIVAHSVSDASLADSWTFVDAMSWDTPGIQSIDGAINWSDALHMIPSFVSLLMIGGTADELLGPPINMRGKDDRYWNLLVHGAKRDVRSEKDPARNFIASLPPADQPFCNFVLTPHDHTGALFEDELLDAALRAIDARHINLVERLRGEISGRYAVLKQLRLYESNYPQSLFLEHKIYKVIQDFALPTRQTLDELKAVAELLVGFYIDYSPVPKTGEAYKNFLTRHSNVHNPKEFHAEDMYDALVERLVQLADIEAASAEIEFSPQQMIDLISAKWASHTHPDPRAKRSMIDLCFRMYGRWRDPYASEARFLKHFIEAQLADRDDSVSLHAYRALALMGLPDNVTIIEKFLAALPAESREKARKIRAEI